MERPGERLVAIAPLVPMYYDVIEHVFSYLPAETLLRASAVAKEWHVAAASDFVWQA